MQTSEELGEASASTSPKDQLMIFPEDYHNTTTGNEDNEQDPISQDDAHMLPESPASSSTTPTRELQPLVPIVGTQAKDHLKCFVHIQPCYPFGMANIDERMLVVTPDVVTSLYEDAVDTTPSDRLKSESKSPHNRKNRQKQPRQHHHGDIPLIDRKVIFEQLPKISYVDLGDNSSETFKRPGAYIYYIDKTPEDEMNQVEYDMDSEDEVFLAKTNRNRRADGLRTLTDDHFETIIDRLEKETFKHQTKIGDFTVASAPIVGVDPDDVCCVCFDGTSDDTNQIVYCDGCNIAIHQECYGITLIPELQWFCQKCERSEEKKKHISCTLCMGKDGALKRTVDGDWVHIICMQWIPEISSIAELGADKEKIGPPRFKKKVPKARWRLTCSICKKKGGACIQCRERVCTTAFHVPCLRKQSFSLGVRETASDSDSEDDEDEYHLFMDWAYCEKHLSQQYKKPKDKPAKKKNKARAAGDSASSSEEEAEKEAKTKPTKEGEKVARKNKKRIQKRKKKKPRDSEQNEGDTIEVAGSDEGEQQPTPTNKQSITGEDEGATHVEETDSDGVRLNVVSIDSDEGEAPTIKQHKNSDSTEEKEAATNDGTKHTETPEQPAGEEDSEAPVTPILDTTDSEPKDVQMEEIRSNGIEAVVKQGGQDEDQERGEMDAKDTEHLEDTTEVEEEMKDAYKGEEPNGIVGTSTKGREGLNHDQSVAKEEDRMETAVEGDKIKESGDNVAEEAQTSTKPDHQNDGNNILNANNNNDGNSNSNNNNSNNTENNTSNSTTQPKVKKKKKTGDLTIACFFQTKRPEDEGEAAVDYREDEELLAKDLPSWYHTLSSARQRELVNKYNLIPIKLAQKIIKAPSQAVATIFPFWTQKRASRSGVPLLKRFQPSILANRKEGKHVESEKETEEILEDMRTIRHDLERVRILLELIKKRERAKRGIVEAVSNWFELSCDPVGHSLNFIMECLHREDKKEIFKYPVTPEIAPGYSDVVKQPMDLTTMRRKLDEGVYQEAEPFWDDANLMFENAKVFNGPKTIIWKDAEHMIKYTAQLRAHFEAGTLLTLDPKAADEATAEHPPIHHPHRKKRRISLGMRRARPSRPRRPMLAFGEFGLKETVEGTEGADDIPASSDGGIAQDGVPADSDGTDIQRVDSQDNVDTTVKKTKKSKPIPDIVPRRSGRNSGELIEETLLEEKKRRKRRSEQSADEEGAQDEDSELNEALELKPSFRMGKNEWYKILDVLEQQDSKNLFKSPVEKMIPDYANFVATPMCFETIRKKVKSFRYAKWDNFWNDSRLICTNSMSFNKANSVFVREAKKLLKFTNKLEINELKKKAKNHLEHIETLGEARELRKRQKTERESAAASTSSESDESPGVRKTRSQKREGGKREQEEEGEEKEEDSGSFGDSEGASEAEEETEDDEVVPRRTTRAATKQGGPDKGKQGRKQTELEEERARKLTKGSNSSAKHAKRGTAKLGKRRSREVEEEKEQGEGDKHQVESESEDENEVDADAVQPEQQDEVRVTRSKLRGKGREEAKPTQKEKTNTKTTTINSKTNNTTTSSFSITRPTTSTPSSPVLPSSSSTPTERNKKRVDFNTTSPHNTLYFDKNESVSAVAKAAKELKERMHAELLKKQQDFQRKAEAEEKKMERKRKQREGTEEKTREASKRVKKNGGDLATHIDLTSSSTSGATSPPKSSEALDSSVRRSHRERTTTEKMQESILLQIATQRPSRPSSPSSKPPSPPISPPFAVWSTRRKQKKLGSPPSGSRDHSNSNNNNNNNNHNNNANSDDSQKNQKQPKINNYFTTLSKSKLDNTTSSPSNSTSSSKFKPPPDILVIPDSPDSTDGDNGGSDSPVNITSPTQDSSSPTSP